MSQTNTTTASSMAPQTTIQPRYQYGIHLAETGTPGYLLVRPLASGKYGDTFLILSIADGHIYVQKVERARFGQDTKDVSNYFAHPNVPRLISYREYQLQDGTNRTTTNWEFCNGGTFGTFAEAGEASRRGTGNGRFTIGATDPGPIPEAFIWCFFEDLLSVVVTSHLKGIAHGDVHDGNIFLHWETPSSTLPKVYLGDFGISWNYPWRSHPDELLNTPWKIPNFDNLNQQQRSLHGRSASQPTSQNTTFRMVDLDHWYYRCTRDLNHMITELYRLFEWPLGASEWDSLGTLHQMGKHRTGMDGHSGTLLRCLYNLRQILADISYESLQVIPQPQYTMDRLQRLLRQVKQGRIQAEADLGRSGPQQKNILQHLRPSLPQPEPATWPTSTAAVVINTDDVEIRSPPQQRWSSSLHLDFGQYQVRRIRREESSGRWEILPDDDYTDSDDRNTHGAADNNDVNDDQTPQEARTIRDQVTALAAPSSQSPQTQSQPQSQLSPREYAILLTSEIPPRQPLHIAFEDPLPKRSLPTQREGSSNEETPHHRQAYGSQEQQGHQLRRLRMAMDGLTLGVETQTQREG